jgi:hypothetical protein
MASEAQIAANRLNAQKSTGPRTEEGKALSSKNHLIHGLTAKGLLPHEDPGQLHQIHEGFSADFHPVGTAEETQVELMSTSYFRLGRFIHCEAQFLQRDPAETKAWPAERRLYDQTTTNLMEQAKRLNALSTYEARLQRSYDRALRTLLHLQAARAKRERELQRQREVQPAPKPPQTETAGPAPEIGFEISKTASASKNPPVVPTAAPVCGPQAPADAQPAQSPQPKTASPAPEIGFEISKKASTPKNGSVPPPAHPISGPQVPPDAGNPRS